MRTELSCNLIAAEDLEHFSQELYRLLCPMCRDKFGRSGPEQQHLREKGGGYCSCCRRFYQRQYQKARRKPTSDPTWIVHAEGEVIRLKNLVKRWYERGYEEEANKELIPMLNDFETKLGRKEVTTARHIRIELIEERLENEDLHRIVAVLGSEKENQVRPA